VPYSYGVNIIITVNSKSSSSVCDVVFLVTRVVVKVGLRIMDPRLLHGNNRTSPLDKTIRKIIIMIIVLNSFKIES
jgi:hypothetical protein